MDKYIIFCTEDKGNGFCKHLKPVVYAEEDYEILYQVPRKCPFTINDIQLGKLSDELNVNLYELLIPDCHRFKPVDNLEKILTVLGDLKFSKKEFLSIETDEDYFIVRVPPEPVKIYFRFRKKK